MKRKSPLRTDGRRRPYASPKIESAAKIASIVGDGPGSPPPPPYPFGPPPGHRRS